MKVLYLSCHSILEYDELRILEEIGVDYFSLGSYINPQSPVDPIRPALRHQPDEWLRLNAPDRMNMPKEFIDKFDTIIVMHVPEWIEKNWEVIKHKTVIWRTIGQSTPSIEQRLHPMRQQGLKVARYSVRERLIRGNIGCDMVIPFYKDEDEYYGWTGASAEVITIAQNMAHRAEFCNYEAFKEIARNKPVYLYGTSNEKSGELWKGFMSYPDMKQKLRDVRAFIYTGTQPACYTLAFIEAMMTGTPVVALGSEHANSLNIAGDMYEIPDIIQNGVNGFVSDDVDYLRHVIDSLLDDHELAKRISENGRKTAIKLFGKELVRNKWKALLFNNQI